MSSTELLAETDGALYQLGLLLEDLEDALAPGNARVWPRLPTADEARERALLEHQERQERAALAQLGVTPSGRTAVPIVLPIADARAAIRIGLAAVEHLLLAALAPVVCLVPRYGAERDQLPARRRTEPLRQVLHLLAGHRALTELAHRETAGLLLAGRTALAGELVTPLGDVRCPICGARSLHAYHDRDMIRCDAGAGCRCQTEGCRCHSGRRHVWRRWEWPILAQIITPPTTTPATPPTTPTASSTPPAAAG